MFISSYNTYVQTDISTKDSRQRFEKSSSNQNSFRESLQNKELPQSSFKNSTLPQDYVSRGQTYSNKQEIELQKKQLQSKQKTPEQETREALHKLQIRNSLSQAANAYENGSKMLSVYTKQNTTLDQTPKISDYLPEEAKSAKELSLRKTMVNTYVANEKYYQITA